MNPLPGAGAPHRPSNPFDLDDEAGYRRWRAAKLAAHPTRVDDLVVDVADPGRLTTAERRALLERVARANMAVYRGPALGEDKSIAIRLGRQLGLLRLDRHWLADEDGVSRITVAPAVAAPRTQGRAGFIPYTDRPIKWHTDGYYHPAGQRIRGMILHCVRPARTGGVNALLDHEMAYLMLRDIAPAHVRALMAPDAMTIPARVDEGGVARAAQAGPVFSVDAHGGALHMRYTARTRSIAWRDDAATHAAVACLEQLLASSAPWIFHIRLAAGMGIVANNVLHDRSGFVDDPAAPRLLHRARYLDRAAAPDGH